MIRNLSSLAPSKPLPGMLLPIGTTYVVCVDGVAVFRGVIVTKVPHKCAWFLGHSENGLLHPLAADDLIPIERRGNVSLKPHKDDEIIDFLNALPACVVASCTVVGPPGVLGERDMLPELFPELKKKVPKKPVGRPKLEKPPVSAPLMEDEQAPKRQRRSPDRPDITTQDITQLFQPVTAALNNLSVHVLSILQVLQVHPAFQPPPPLAKPQPQVPQPQPLPHLEPPVSLSICAVPPPAEPARRAQRTRSRLPHDFDPISQKGVHVYHCDLGVGKVVGGCRGGDLSWMTVHFQSLFPLSEKPKQKDLRVVHRDVLFLE